MTSFDPTLALRFDLDHGRVSLADESPMLLVSAPALAEACGSLSAESARKFGASLGAGCGKRVLARLGAEPVTLELMVNQLGGEMALAGFGSLSLERWGQALVAKMEACPLDVRARSLMSAFLEGALQSATGRSVRAVFVEGGSRDFRLLLCSEVGAAKVEGWLAEGRSWGDALSALHGSRGAAQEA